MSAQHHVLLVEDSELAALPLQLFLEDAGHRVTHAMTLADTVRVCIEDRPELVLLDLGLPDGEGLDLFPLLAKAGVAPPRVVFALTGYDEPSVRRKCLEAGCAQVLVKPVSAVDVVRRVGEALAAPPAAPA